MSIIPGRKRPALADDIHRASNLETILESSHRGYCAARGNDDLQAAAGRG